MASLVGLHILRGEGTIRFARAEDPYAVVDARIGSLHWDPCWRDTVGGLLLGLGYTCFARLAHRVAARVLILRL